MKKNYQISGMTCNGCLMTVKRLLESVEGVKNVNISLASGEAEIETDHLVSSDVFKSALQDYPAYQITDVQV